MSFKEIYNHILLGAGITALVTIMSGTASTITPLASKNIELTEKKVEQTLNLKLPAPQCKVVNKIFGFPRCEDTAKTQTTNRLH